MGLLPQKPKWLPEWEEDSSLDRDNLINYVEDALANFEREDNTLDLLAISLPIKLDDERWVDLTVVKVITELEQEANIQIEERSGCLTVGNLLDKPLSYEFAESEKSEVTVLASTAYPFMRYGHWHSDLESRGLYTPKCNIAGKKIIGSSSGSRFGYFVGDDNIGFSSFWYNDWQPIHPKGVRSLCGSFTAVNRDKIGKWLNLSVGRQKSYYVCTAVVLTSEDSFRDYDQHVFSFSVGKL
ncbi:hypothetical protein VCSRO53_3591 [Vibrio cholerae]|nr:hypothetical protein VCSRO53_3591 [Vibrio cholerae]